MLSVSRLSPKRPLEYLLTSALSEAAPG